MDNEDNVTEHLLSDDDSDVDVVTDFLDITNDKASFRSSSVDPKSPSPYDGAGYISNHQHLNNNSDQNNHHYNSSSNSNHISLINIEGSTTMSNLGSGGGQINMVPIISVTPHSPGAKYNCILEDTLNQLQTIRENVVQMKNASPQSHNTIGLLANSKNFTSCPSLPELNENSQFWPVSNTIYSGIPKDRRKSWTAVEDLTECTKNLTTTAAATNNNTSNSHKSISLSSLDSEEQESYRAERIHNRSSRNSTGGISTHSLNEAELARDFERVAAKRNLTPAVCRIPLQKSISTPSIAPIRNQNAKEENISSSQHLSDSEDETQDDRSLLSMRDKNEVNPDLHEKRKKRGSIFFRKKKDKNKNKDQAVNSESTKFGAGKKSGSSHHSSHHDDHSRDAYDGHMRDEHSNYTDETPLMREEFLHEAPIGVHELSTEVILGIGEDEPEQWCQKVPKEILSTMKKPQVKRQEHIYEFIMSEKTHCQTLLVMQKVFVESLQRHFHHHAKNTERMFPRLTELTEIHTGFLRKLRLKQRESITVDSIADLLLDFFSSMSAQRLKSVYGEFCSNHRSALETFKLLKEDPNFNEWYKHCQQNPVLKKKGIPECHLFVTQRLTKYPLLIESQLKISRDDKTKEKEKLEKALSLVRNILYEVNARVAEKDKEDRQLEIFKRTDAKSSASFKKETFKKSDIISCNRKLKFEGLASLMLGRNKTQNVLVVVLSDCLFFLQENAHKYQFFTPDNKAGVVSLQKLIIRAKAGTGSSVFILSSDPTEMFELEVQNPKDKNEWIQAIGAAVVDCPAFEEAEDHLTAEQRQRLLETRHANIRETICKMRQKDFEQAILLEEKIAMQLQLLLENRKDEMVQGLNVDDLLENFGSYRDLVTDDCDNVEIWKRVLLSIQEISLLASSLYTAATGLPFARSFTSISERQSELFVSPTLPKRAETFGGFDERRTKMINVNPSRDAVLSAISAYSSQARPLDNHRDSAIEPDASTYSVSSKGSAETEMLKDTNYAALQVSHHLHTLLCIISQQMTTIQSLQSQLNVFKENPKSIFRHNDQLEELRNLYDKLQEEKQTWTKEREEQQRELEEQRVKQNALHEQLKADQEDIAKQREQLYRKMEILSSQGLLISANTPLPVQGHVEDPFLHHTTYEETHTDSSAASRRNEKWRSASVPKTPPAHLLSATNAPKVAPGTVKQTIPLKLSSLSNTKSAGSSSSSSSSIMSPISSAVTQILPYKLADKSKNQTVTPNHSRTGSSPAIIQQPISNMGSNPATRTNTYPKLPERYRLRSSDGVSGSPSPADSHQKRSASVVGQLPVTFSNASPMTTTPPSENSSSSGGGKGEKTEEEEVIFF